MIRRYGRRTEYTERGLRRLPCVRCGHKATQQWRTCADGLWRPICTECDIKLNQKTLWFMGDPDLQVKMNKYEHKLRGGAVGSSGRS